MRVALLFSGLPRMWDGSIQTQLRLFTGADVDIYCHFWDTIDGPEKQRLLDLLRPKVYAFDPLPDFSCVDQYPGLQRDEINIPSRLVSQYSSWQQVATMFAPFAPRYALAARTRTDLHFHQELRFNVPKLALQNVDLLGCIWPSDPRMLLDAFAVGRPNMMLYYHSLLGWVWHYASNTLFNPEILLTKHIAAYPGKAVIVGLNRQTPGYALPFFVRRPHMKDWPVEQCLTEGIGQSKWRDPEIYGAHVAFHEKIAGPAGALHVASFKADRLDGQAPGEPDRAADPVAQDQTLASPETS